jgi:hypothetical protein
MKRKTLYLNGEPVASAHTWHEVAKILTSFLGRAMSVQEVQERGSEGPEGFYVSFVR